MSELLGNLLLVASGLSFGLLASAGVFTVLAAVGLIPRFAGKTHTADKVLLYENMVILGTIAGGIASLFERYLHVGVRVYELGVSLTILTICGNVFTGIFGVFAGIFVGCLALAIAEMLDSIPIFTRRIRFKMGLGVTIYAMAIGKLTGSVLYFVIRLHDAVK